MIKIKSIALFSVLFFTIVSCKDTASAPTKEVEVVKKLVKATNPQTATFQIEGMTCAIGCAKTIAEDLSSMDGVVKAEVDFEKKTATVAFDADKLQGADLVKKAEAAADGASYKVSNLKITK